MPTVLEYAAFTRDPHGGNPAGITLDASGLDDAQMQRIAADLGHSETAFVVAESGNRLTLRYFSPQAEVPFCGHATIATAVAVAERHGPGERTFATPAGDVAVTVTDGPDGLAAEFASVPASTEPAPPQLVDDALAALRWTSGDLHSDWPAHVSYAGAHHLVLVTATRERLAALDYDFDALRDIMLTADLTTLQLVHPTGPDSFAARNPFPVGGVVEDPATGAAAAALGAYLHALDPRPETRTVHIVQGDDMGFYSELTVTVAPDDARIRVAGTAVPLAAERTGATR